MVKVKIRLRLMHYKGSSSCMKPLPSNKTSSRLIEFGRVIEKVSLTEVGYSSLCVPLLSIANRSNRELRVLIFFSKTEGYTSDWNFHMGMSLNNYKLCLGAECHKVFVVILVINSIKDNLFPVGLRTRLKMLLDLLVHVVGDQVLYI